MAFMMKRKSKKLGKIQGVYEVGDLVLLNKKRQGIVRYIGQLFNKDGVWYGIELTDKHEGENNGSIGKQQYFECKVKGKGIFVKPKHLVQILAKHEKKQPVTALVAQSQSQLKLSERKSIDDIITIGSPFSPAAPTNLDHNYSDVFEMDNPTNFEPARAPSQQKITVESNVNIMLQNVPKSDDNNKNDIVSLQLENEVSILNKKLEIYKDEEIEAKRIKISQELNNLKPIELKDKLCEYMLNTDMNVDKIQMLQKMINSQ